MEVYSCFPDYPFTFPSCKIRHCILRIFLIVITGTKCSSNKHIMHKSACFTRLCMLLMLLLKCLFFSFTQFPEVISLNVGGAYFTTRLSTLRRFEDTMLAAMFSGRHYIPRDADGRYFIDRDGAYFGWALLQQHLSCQPASCTRYQRKVFIYHWKTTIVFTTNGLHFNSLPPA